MFKRCSGATECILLATALLFLTTTVSSVSSEVLFFDGFHNSNLPEWDVSDAKPPGDVSVGNGMLTLGNNAGLKIEVPQSYTWKDYTTTFRLRLREREKQATFAIFVRFSLGPFGYWTHHQINFSPHERDITSITAYTFNPQKPPRDEEDVNQAIRARGTARYTLDRNKWYLIEIETIDNLVNLSIDGQEVLLFDDNAPLAGTVAVTTNHEKSGKIRIDLDFIRVETDDLLSIKPRYTYATTWGAIKNSKTEVR